MSYAQWVEEQEYNRDDSAWLEAMRADNVDHFADEQPYTCTEHDYEDYDNPCPQVHAPVAVPAPVADPDYPEPPF